MSEEFEIYSPRKIIGGLYFLFISLVLVLFNVGQIALVNNIGINNTLFLCLYYGFILTSLALVWFWYNFLRNGFLKTVVFSSSVNILFSAVAIIFFAQTTTHTSPEFELFKLFISNMIAVLMTYLVLAGSVVLTRKKKGVPILNIDKLWNSD